MEDYYQILGIGRDASNKEIWEAAKSKRKIYGPGGERKDSERYDSISRASRVLCNPRRRMLYDYGRNFGEREDIIELEEELDSNEIRVVKEGLETRLTILGLQSRAVNKLYGIAGTCGLGSLFLFYQKGLKESALMLALTAITTYVAHVIKKNSADKKEKCEEKIKDLEQRLYP